VIVGTHSPESYRPARASWWDQAACIGQNPEWWSDDADGWEAAVEICASCVARKCCLAEALALGDVGVIRGGMLFRNSGRGFSVSKVERSTVRRSRAQADARVNRKRQVPSNTR
jgi:hypothetical protein